MQLFDAIVATYRYFCVAARGLVGVPLLMFQYCGEWFIQAIIMFDHH